MSWQATAYVKELLVCPDGARLSRGQKLLAFTLADYHNTTHHAAWPSVPTLAREALTSLAQAKRDLAYLEDHFLIRKIRPEKMGRGWVCAYKFLKLDAEKELNALLQKSTKGAHSEPFFCSAESSSEGAHAVPESSSEQGQKGLTASGAIRKKKEPELGKENEKIPPNPPSGGLTPRERQRLSKELGHIYQSSVGVLQDAAFEETALLTACMRLCLPLEAARKAIAESSGEISA